MQVSDYLTRTSPLELREDAGWALGGSALCVRKPASTRAAPFSAARAPRLHRELALQPDEARQSGLDGVDRFVHVGAVQQQGGIQAERIACAEAARGSSRVHEGVPERRCGFRRRHDLDAVLAGVAGAGDERRRAHDLGFHDVERAHRIGVETGDFRRDARAVRSLQRDHRDLGGAIGERRVGEALGAPSLQPRQDLPGVRGVRDDHESLVGEPVDDGVVDDAAGLVAEEAVTRAAHRHRLADVAGVHPVEEGAGVRAVDPEASHVGDVEDAGGRSDGSRLGEDACVLHGHVVPGERHHACAEGDVVVVQDSGAEGRVCHVLRVA